MGSKDNERQPHALVVEDESVVRHLICSVLNMAGYRCTEAADGEEALDILSRAGDDMPTIGLLDLSMPKMDGVDLAGAIKSNYPGIPLVAVTGTARTFDLEDLLGAGFDAVLAKPFDNKHLLEICGELS